MKKEDLVKLGLSEEDAQKVADVWVESLKGFIPKSRFDEVNTEKKNLETTVKERDTQLEDLKNSNDDVKDLKKQIETLQADNKIKDEEHKTEIKQLRIDAAVSTVLNTSKAKNQKAVKALLDLEDVELLDDGTIKGLDEQIKTLTESEDSKFLFETEKDKKPSFKGVNPGQSGSDDIDDHIIDADTELSDLSYLERLKLKEKNPEVYDKLLK